MPNFPQSILEFMLHLTVEHRTPAYLAIDSAGEVQPFVIVQGKDFKRDKAGRPQD